MSQPDSARKFSVAIGKRFDSAKLLDGVVRAEGLELEYPDVPRVPTTGAPMPLFSILAREHPWDIGEMAFSTYLMGRSLGKPYIALPIFPSRFFPHTGAWVNGQSDIQMPSDLEDQRVACGSFGTNYSVWWRGALTHQYDVPIQKITWVESAEEHIPEFRPPKRFAIERIPGQTEPVEIVGSGRSDAATLPGPARGADLERIRPLFADPYPEIGAYVEANGFFPINTVITARTDAVERNPEMPQLILAAYTRAKALYELEIAEGKVDLHMGLSLQRLRQATGKGLPEYGFCGNRQAIRTMLAYCYEQSITSVLYESEDVFLLTDS